MAESILHSRCFEHAQREAVARCPECRRFYCRECVTEHDGRVLCRSCLEMILTPAVKERSRLIISMRSWFLAAFGILITLYVFYILGRILLGIPSDFHTDLLLNQP